MSATTAKLFCERLAEEKRDEWYKRDGRERSLECAERWDSAAAFYALPFLRRLRNWPRFWIWNQRCVRRHWNMSRPFPGRFKIH